jgi:tripartite-type tricarboxylate transporter receptor subunit TctC
MKKLFSILALSAAAVTMAGAVTGTTAAQAAADIPCSTAKLIVPWKAGGGTHVIFSIFEKTIQDLDVTPKIQVVLFAIHQSAITSFLNGRIDFQYDGFETVANLTVTPDIIGAAADTPYSNFEEFAAYANANPGAIKAGTTFGSTSHFIWLLLAQKMGVEFSYVPYDGTRERMTALLSGAIDVGALNVASGRKYLEGGELKGFAIAADERAKQLPDMPTLKEVGVDMTFALERGIVAPKGTPKDVIDVWAGVFKAAAENPDLLAQMDAKGTGVRYMGPADFRAWADAIYADYEAVAIQIGMYKK